MGLSVYALGGTFLFAALLACTPPVTAQADRAPDFGVADKGPDVPALSHVRQLLEQGHLEDALAAAQAVIAHPPKTYVTGHNIDKSDQMNKARAYNLEAYAYMTLGRGDDAFDAWSEAAEMGDVDGLRSVAERLMLKIARSKVPERRAIFQQRMESTFLACAELADVFCINIVEAQYADEGDEDSSLYWLLLRNILRKETETATKNLSKEEQEQLNQVMRSHALAPPVPASPALNLPARTALTSAQVDLVLRLDLEKVWDFFWEEDNKAEEQTVLQLFREDQALLRSQTPFADGYLLLTSPTALKDPNIIRVRTQSQLMENLQNGDRLVVRCGQLTHMAIVWSVDARNVVFLDPFYEFWQPTHNVCVKHMNLIAYKYSRLLVGVPRDEVGKMLEAIATIRDAR